MHKRASLSLIVPAALLLLGGCIIVADPNNTTTSSGGFTSSSSSSSGTGGGGTGGETGSSSSSGSGGAGGGGGSMCVDNVGSKDVSACEALNTQGASNTCGATADQAPLANGVCKRGAEIYQGGSFDVLHSCLQKIELADACNNTLVTDCITEMYVATCPSTEAATLCDSITVDYCNGAVFDSSACLFEINPLNSTALGLLKDCVILETAGGLNCNDAYSKCFDDVTSF